MTGKIEFFYDYVSVYSYLADTQLHKLDAEIVYRPMLLGAVMQATGNRPPATIEAKGNYLQSDIGRWAQAYDVDLVWNSVFPQNTIKALRIALLAQERGEFMAIHRALMTAAWVRNLDINEPETLANLMTDAGLDPDVYSEAIAQDEVKNLLRANTEEALARGIFGAPTFFVGEEMYFGNDRLGFVKEALARRV